jgi:hypothetical protein
MRERQHSGRELKEIREIKELFPTAASLYPVRSSCLVAAAHLPYFLDFLQFPATNA